MLKIRMVKTASQSHTGYEGLFEKIKFVALIRTSQEFYS